ncbi:hypothetical protein NEOC65_000630 [Neochlamydia sp. AcF65]|nr:hypothetical protein [Neochlamydia sp. AcF65]
MLTSNISLVSFYPSCFSKHGFRRRGKSILLKLGAR